jgi:hypothetical protein
MSSLPLADAKAMLDIDGDTFDTEVAAQDRRGRVSRWSGSSAAQW